MAGMEWNGFSEEEIRRIHANNGNIMKTPIAENDNATNEVNHIKRPIVKKGILKKTKYLSKTQPILDPITPQQKLSKLKVEFAENIDDRESRIEDQLSECYVESVDCESEKSTSKHVTIDEEKNTIRHDASILEQFEQRQKQMEEENARRRLLLTKAIAYRKKRTQAEAQKLSKVQKELGHLDSLVSVDVSILRNQIEIASMDFTEAQKRYQKAEKEYVEAKLELFQKMQRKEQLTEHLCTIIEQNEARKARKLVELMQQLEMDLVDDSCDSNGVSAVLPQLCALNNVDYSLCTTLKPPINTVDNDNKTGSQDSIGGKSNETLSTSTANNEVQEETNLHTQINDNELRTNKSSIADIEEVNDNKPGTSIKDITVATEVNDNETEINGENKNDVNCNDGAG